MADFTPKPVKVEDSLAKWYESSDGRLYTRMKEDQFNDPKFKAACVDACNNNFPNGGTQDGFDFEGETYSLSEFNGNVSVYKDAAKYKNNKVVKLPEKWGQTNFKKGFDKKPFVPAKILVQGAGQEVQWVTEDVASQRTKAGSEFVQAIGYSELNENDEKVVLIYKPVTL